MSSNKSINLPSYQKMNTTNPNNTLNGTKPKHLNLTTNSLLPNISLPVEMFVSNGSTNNTSRSYDYQYISIDMQPCLISNRAAGALFNDEIVAYEWGQMPNHGDPSIFVVMWMCGIFGLCLNLFCWRVILRNANLSKAVRLYLLFDCYCRLNESWTYFYKAYCVLSWQCISPYGSPISGLTINMIIIAVNLGMNYSMQTIGNGLCLNRVFAVFFDGLYYRRVERYALPHVIILFIIPIAVYCYEIGNLMNTIDDYLCYGGFYFAPMYLRIFLTHGKDPVALFLIEHFDQIMYVLWAITLTLDLLILRKVWKISKSSDSDLKNRSDLRLLIMMVTTHSITVCFLAGNLLMNRVLNLVTLPVHNYLVLEVYPFLLHCLLSCMVIVFNMKWQKKRSSISVRPSGKLSPNKESFSE